MSKLLMPLNAAQKIDEQVRHAGLDALLRTRLHSDAVVDPDYWSFRKNAIREHAHAFFQYPAMMVPQMLARLLSDVLAIRPDINNAYDPFVGSGTVLTEAMLRGMNFLGRDINPLAILLCRVKAGPFYAASLAGRAAMIEARIGRDNSLGIEHRFRGWNKWFRRDVAIALSRIARAIRKEREVWSRRFFWISLAETVRLVSNSRTSTFKLHIRPREEIRSRKLDPVATFLATTHGNLQHLTTLRNLLHDMSKLNRGAYEGLVQVSLGDTSASFLKQPLFDLMITSPPYGDNVTTVPYGQHSYLPLNWIDLDDTDIIAHDKVIANTHTIDSMSLGGSRRNALEDVAPAVGRSKSLAEILRELSCEKEDRRTRVAAFYRDLDQSLDGILSHLRPNAYMFWIVGDRRVAKRIIPLHSILRELLISRGAVFVTTVERAIPSKRMAIRNNTAQTMRTETILVMRKVS